MRRLSLWTLSSGALLLVACDRSSPAAAEASPRETTAASSAAPASAPAPSSPEASAPEASSPSPEPVLGRAPLGAAPTPASAPRAIPTDGPRVHALTRNVWIRSAPESGVQWIGSLWLGGSVKVRGPERVPGVGCADVWVPVEPRGWVCVDGRRTTLDPEHPALVRLFPDSPRTETPWPHRYAVVPRDVTRYRLPPEVTPGRPGAAELTAQLPFALTRQLTPDLPPGLYEGRTKVVARSALAYVRELPLGEHTYLLLPDFSFVRRDQVELVPQGEFVGVRLGAELQLPVGFVRDADVQLYRLSPTGDAEPTGAPLARHTSLALGQETRQLGEETYYPVRGSELWLRARDAVIPRPSARAPFGDTLPAGRATWLEGSILGGWLVAFEGTTPVYATLIAAGRGGTPVSGRDPVSTASTPTGRFFITGKFRTATMESSTTPIVHGDVPWTQNFSGPHAIHSAYWHDDWGDLKSAGCVNVAPRDGQWLFDFTEPAVPAGWHAVKHIPRDGPATVLILHE